MTLRRVTPREMEAGMSFDCTHDDPVDWALHHALRVMLVVGVAGLTWGPLRLAS